MLTFFVSLAAMAATAAPPVFQPDIAARAAQVRTDSIEAHLRRLQAFRTRYAPTDSCRAAETYVHDLFAALPLDSVRYDTAWCQGVAMRNVVGVLRGSEEPGSRVLIGAHLDAISKNPLECAPGIEDNGSGVSVVLEAARALSGTRPRRSIEFIAFTGEELGFVGSEHLAADYAARGVDVAAFLNLDMIAWPGGAFGMKIICDTTTRPLAELQSAATRLYTSLDPQIVQRVPLPSDNYPFQIRGFPAISNIERFEHDTDGYKWYHDCGDSLDHLSLPLATEIAKAAVATLLLFQDPAIVPPASLRARPDPARSVRVDRTATGWTFEYRLDVPESVHLSILDPLGRRIADLSPGPQGAGSHSVAWNPGGRGSRLVAVRLGNLTKIVVLP